jgi:hypothetical protein
MIRDFILGSIYLLAVRCKCASVALWVESKWKE